MEWSVRYWKATWLLCAQHSESYAQMKKGQVFWLTVCINFGIKTCQFKCFTVASIAYSICNCRSVVCLFEWMCVVKLFKSLLLLQFSPTVAKLGTHDLRLKLWNRFSKFWFKNYWRFFLNFKFELSLRNSSSGTVYADSPSFSYKLYHNTGTSSRLPYLITLSILNHLVCRKLQSQLWCHIE